jgi:hypothetical protein
MTNQNITRRVQGTEAVAKVMTDKLIALGAVITVGAESTNVINCAIQVNKGITGSPVAEAIALPFYFSSDSSGQVPLTTAVDGGIAIGTDGALLEWTANISGLLITEADGDCDIDVTDAGAFTSYLNIVLPDGSLVTSAVLTHAA